MSSELTFPVDATQTATSEAATEAAAMTSSRAARLTAIDALRGFVIVLMVLDHVRDYFSAAHFSPTDLSKTTPLLFATRWITHLCAPTFVFLAGTSAFLLSRRLTRAALSRYLLTRGLWLIALEFTIVNFVWSFNFGYEMGLLMQVIWVLGLSMCIMAGLVFLPLSAIAVIAALTVVGHHLLDPIAPADFGAWAPLWNILHVQGRTPFGYVHYPLIPWFGVMALGFCFGALYTRAPRPERVALWSGLALFAAFLLSRALHAYGEPRDWSAQADPVFTALSFMNLTKYPPSLAYLLATLGLALMLLALLGRSRGWVDTALVTFGRVPLFAYVVHIALAHLFAGLTAMAMGHGDAVLVNFFTGHPPDWGFGLGGVYLAWVTVLVVLYPACRWFAALKRSSDARWLAYL